MNTLYAFWTGSNIMSENRKICLQQLESVSGANVTLVNKDNLDGYILPEEPLHPAYEYLSATHRADYLRTYFMNFHGGGYSDIKRTTGCWISSFDELRNNKDKWMIGYTELEGFGEPSLRDKWRELIGNGCYIAKPQTPLTNEWYNSMISVLDNNLELLKRFPATFEQDCAEVSNAKYPLAWEGILRDVFHPVCYKYREKILNTLPIAIFSGYR